MSHMNDPYEDPTQDRMIGHEPNDDPTQGGEVGAEPYDGPTPAGVQRLFASFLAAKSAANVNQTMAFFNCSDMTYWDGTAGWEFPDWAALKAGFEQYMSTWGPAARSYETNLLGDDTGAALFFTNTPEEFGQEIRGISVVDIRDCKFIRWIDHWDGRHYGIAALKDFRSPPRSSRATLAGHGRESTHRRG